MPSRKMEMVALVVIKKDLHSALRHSRGYLSDCSSILIDSEVYLPFFFFFTVCVCEFGVYAYVHMQYIYFVPETKGSCQVSFSVTPHLILLTEPGARLSASEHHRSFCLGALTSLGDPEKI